MRELRAPSTADLHFTSLARDLALDPSNERAAIQRVLTALPGLLSAYRALIISRGVLAGSRISEPDSIVLRGAYRALRKRKGPGSLREAVLNNSSNPFSRCCYCEIGSAKQIDHFIAKKTHAEYALEVVNLVPSCSTCNQRKGSKFLSKLGVRFPHPYFDRQPRRYLYAEIALVEGTYRAKFKIAGLQNSPNHASIKRLFKQLDLLEEYRIEGNMLLAEEFETIQEHQAVGDLGVWARKEWNKARRIHHANHWKAALYDAIAKLDHPLGGDVSE